MAPPTIYTYHCLCTSLLLASTHQLSSLPRRAPPAQDEAIILALPSATLNAESYLSVGDGESDTPSPQDDMPALGHTSLLGMARDRRVTVVRREDGFEKRYLWRCGRCRLVVGYELDEEHFPSATKLSTTNVTSPSDTNDGNSERRKIVYLLPAGIMSTDVMTEGRKINEENAILGNATNNSIAVWE